MTHVGGRPTPHSLTTILTEPEPASARPQGNRWGNSVRPRPPVVVACLIVSLALAAFFRCFELSASGFADDETATIRAGESYRHLDFSADSEHPMLAKSAALASTSAARLWNEVSPRLHLPGITPETALRLPMALAGTLSTLAIFLVVERLFAVEVAAWACWLWALDVNATGLNRLAKEDTLFVFFLLVAIGLYERAKHEGRRDVERAQRWYVGSGAAFGLMMASKYMPHYFGLYGLVNTISDPKPGQNYPRKIRYYGAAGMAFVIANFGLFLPATWRHLASYLHGRTALHTGYQFAQHLYVNSVTVTPWGTPASFYLVFLATKIPILILIALVLGLVQMMRRGDERGFVFTRVFFVFFLLPYSLAGGKFVRYALPLLAVVDILAAVGIVWMWRQATQWLPQRHWRPFAAALVTVPFACAPFYAEVSARPFYPLYQNAISARLAPPGHWFPDDELYDTGVREAVDAIARVAKPGAVIASDASGVVADYVARTGRTDLRVWSLSHDGLPMTPVQTWVIVQEGHIYYENQALIAQVRQRMRPWREFRVKGVIAAQIFCVRE